MFQKSIAKIPRLWNIDACITIDHFFLTAHKLLLTTHTIAYPNTTYTPNSK